MNTSFSRIYPEATLTSIVLLKSTVDDAYGPHHEGLALRIYVCRTTTSSHIIVVSHVNVRHQVFFFLEPGKLQAILYYVDWICGNIPCIYQSCMYSFSASPLQITLVVEILVVNVNIIFQRE